MKIEYLLQAWPNIDFLVIYLHGVRILVAQILNKADSLV